MNRYLYPPVSEGTVAEKAEEESERIMSTTATGEVGVFGGTLRSLCWGNRGRCFVRKYVVGSVGRWGIAVVAEEAGDVP